jgi:hypothetical protein
MVATRYVYSKGRIFTQGILAAFTVLFSFIALFFIGTPKLGNQGSSNQDLSADFFTQDVAHAETPYDFASGGDGGGAGAAGGCGSAGAGAGGCGK